MEPCLPLNAAPACPSLLPPQAPAAEVSTVHPFPWLNQAMPPRPVLTTRRPKGEAQDCTVAMLSYLPFRPLVEAVAAARVVLDAVGRQEGWERQGCIILRAESLFQTFATNRQASMHGEGAGLVGIADESASLLGSGGRKTGAGRAAHWSTACGGLLKMSSPVGCLPPHEQFSLPLQPTTATPPRLPPAAALPA